MDSDRIFLAVLSKPETRSQGRLVALDGRVAEVALEGSFRIERGELVEFSTQATLYLGEVESSEVRDSSQLLRVNVEHSLDLAKAAWIQKLWNMN